MKSIYDWDEEELGRLDHWIWLFSDILQMILVVLGVGLLAASIAGLELTTLAIQIYIAGFMLFIYIFLKISYRYAIIRQSIEERVYWVGVSVSSFATFALLLIGNLCLRLLMPSGELGILYVLLVMVICGLFMIYLYYAKVSNFIVNRIRQVFCGSDAQWKKVSRNLKLMARGSFISGTFPAMGLWVLYLQFAWLVAEGEWFGLAAAFVFISETLLFPYIASWRWMKVENVLD